MTSDIQTITVPSHIGPLLIVTFEQSRSTKGVAQATLSVASDASLTAVSESTVLGQVLRQLRASTLEAHGVDVMPHQDDWYWLDPWPPKRGEFHYHTKLKYGDGVSNLRDHAAFTLRMAQARGVEIRIPIDNPAPRVQQQDWRFPSYG